MIRLVAAVLAIYLGAVLAASSYLSVVNDAQAVAAPLPHAGDKANSANSTSPPQAPAA